MQANMLASIILARYKGSLCPPHRGPSQSLHAFSIVAAKAAMVPISAAERRTEQHQHAACSAIQRCVIFVSCAIDGCVVSRAIHHCRSLNRLQSRQVCQYDACNASHLFRLDRRLPGRGHEAVDVCMHPETCVLHAARSPWSYRGGVPRHAMNACAWPC